MTHFLLDTNIVSSLIKHPRSPVLERLTQVGEANVYTSVIVAAELRFGAAKGGSHRLQMEVDARLARLRVAKFGPPTDRIYAELRARLERAGTPIGANDLWIAAQALQDDSVLVTDNAREFGRVPELRIENWLRM